MHSTPFPDDVVADSEPEREQLRLQLKVVKQKALARRKENTTTNYPVGESFNHLRLFEPPKAIVQVQNTPSRQTQTRVEEQTTFQAKQKISSRLVVRKLSSSSRVKMMTYFFQTAPPRGRRALQKRTRSHFRRRPQIPSLFLALSWRKIALLLKPVNSSKTTRPIVTMMGRVFDVISAGSAFKAPKEVGEP
jgi:hypothetical protein